jgi:2-polyprenyl-3-methyl-5-hydroxy-6-metoxy-1,4-benzoquinol methylase
VADLPTQEELSAYYQNLYYQTERSSSYAASYPPAEIEYKKLKLSQQSYIVDGLRQCRGPGSLLDVGCGEGFALAWYSQSGWTVAGLDFSSAGLRAMNPELADRLETGDLFTNLSERIERGQRYDLVYLNNVLEHVLDPVGLLTKLRKLVSADGVLVVTVPNDDTHYHDTLIEEVLVPGPFWIVVPDHISYFNSNTLRQTAESTGWSVQTVVGDFPIDLFLQHGGANYVRSRSKGPEAHQARIRTERVISERGVEAVNGFYEALANVGLGRNLTAFMVPA